MGSSNPYDGTQEWLPEQREMAGAPYSDPTYYAPAQQQTLVNYPYYTGNIAGAQTAPQSNQGPGTGQQTRQNKKASDRMPKAQAVSMARTLKRSIVVASIAVFGVLSGLVATHLQTTTTTSQPTSASQNTSSSSNSSSTSSSASSSNAGSNPGSNQNPSNATNSGGFFNQQGGGYGFGNGGSAQPPVSNSRVS